MGPQGSLYRGSTVINFQAPEDFTEASADIQRKIVDIEQIYRRLIEFSHCGECSYEVSRNIEARLDSDKPWKTALLDDLDELKREAYPILIAGEWSIHFFTDMLVIKSIILACIP